MEPAPSHDIMKGPAGVEKFFVDLFANGVTAHKLELIETEGDAGLIAAAGKWSATGQGRPWHRRGGALHL
jgi:ketosteroid isomerase-like protein